MSRKRVSVPRSLFVGLIVLLIFNAGMFIYASSKIECLELNQGRSELC